MTARGAEETEPIAVRKRNVGCLLNVESARSLLAYFRGALVEAVAICERGGLPWTPIVLACKGQMELKRETGRPHISLST